MDRNFLKTSLITFADTKFENSRNITKLSCGSFVDNIKDYKPEDIDNSYISRNAHIYYQNRGFGYWIWKPWIILDYLKNNSNEGDIVVYCDSGDKFTPSLLEKAKSHLNKNYLFAIQGGFISSNYTKRDCFILMDCDEEKYWSSGQIYASISFWKNCKESIEFLEEWINYCSNENIVTDKPNTLGENLPGFVDHRHDQSIFSNLVLKRGIKTFWQLSGDPWEVEDE